MSFSELIGEKDVIRIHLPLTINKGFDAVGVRYGSGLFSEFRVRLGDLLRKIGVSRNAASGDSFLDYIASIE